MPSKKIPIAEIREDLRSGLGDVPIMEKYQISPSELVRIKSEPDYSGQISGEFPTAERVMKERRSLPRREPLYLIPICDAGNPRFQGVIHDIHNKGLKVSGITVQTNEEMALMVPAGLFHVHHTFRFQAECRWSMINDYGECVAGFQITNISWSDKRELEALIEHLSVKVTP